MKICSLLPSGTEVLFAVGLGEQVIGITDLCDFPAEARRRHIVSRSLIDTAVLDSAEVNRQMEALLADGRSPYELDVAWLNEARPDLVLTQDTCYRCDVDASEVDRALSGIVPRPAVLVLNPRTMDEILDSIVAVGQAAGAYRQAGALVANLRGRLDHVARQAAQAVTRPRVLSLEGLDPLAAGGDWLPDMKALAGGHDALFSPGCPARRLAWEEIIAARPEVLLITPCSSNLGRSMREIQGLADRPGWWALPAVQTGQVYVVDHVHFSRPGPRIVTGVEILAQLLHPGLFSGLIPAGTVLQFIPLAPGEAPPQTIAGRFAPFPHIP